MLLKRVWKRNNGHYGDLALKSGKIVKTLTPNRNNFISQHKTQIFSQNLEK
jgi:hypothetical protein